MTETEIIDKKNILKELLDSSQRKLADSHFNLGRRLHISTYYYVKSIFQNSIYSKMIAALLKDQISGAMPPFTDTTFIGYGNYTGLFMNELCSLFAKNKVDVNYALIEESEEGYSFLFYPELKENLIFILPITCTYGAYFEARGFIQSYLVTEKLKPRKFCSKAFNVFLIADKRLQLDVPTFDDVYVRDLPTLDLQQLYSSYRWTYISREKVVFSTEDSSNTSMLGPAKLEGYYLISKPSELFLVENCPLCFPPEEKLETPLFQTHTNHDAPNHILNLPQFCDAQWAKGGERFNKVMSYSPEKPFVQLCGYLRIDNNIYMNYVQRDVYYHNNKNDILYFFTKKIGAILSTITKENDELKKIVFVIPGHVRISTFIDDILQADILNKMNVSVIRYKPLDEFVENFIGAHRNLINEADKIFYFDDIIAGVNTFKFVSDCLKNARISESEGLMEKGFDAILTLVDRTPELIKKELKRNLATPQNASAENLFISFFKLNVPALDPTRTGKPTEKRIRSLSLLFEESHLDGLKLFLGGEIRKRLPRRLEIMERDYTEFRLDYFPFDGSLDCFLLYEKKYTYQQRDLMRLEVSHDIGGWFSEKQDFNLEMLEELIKELTCDAKLREYFRLPEGSIKGRDPVVEENIVRAIIIKSFSRPPFTFYKRIYETLFYYINDQLKKRCIDLDKKMEGGMGAISFADLHELKFLIRRSVELNSNFIISQRFLLLLKNHLLSERHIMKILAKNDSLIKTTNVAYRSMRERNNSYRMQQAKSIKYFLLSCYKELLSKNHVRSIRLEKLMNSKILLPIGVDESDGNTALEDVINDSFYALGRILKTENIFLLSQLKEIYIQDNLREKKLVEEITRIYDDNKDDANTVAAIKEVLTPGIDFESPLLQKIKAIAAGEEISGPDKLKQLSDIFIKKASIDFESAKKSFKKYANKRYFDPANFESDTLTQVRDFLHASRLYGTDIFDTEIRDAVISMLYTVSLLLKPEKKKYETTESPEQSFNKELHKILKAACSIIGNNLQYGFFIEYREQTGKKDIYADNIFAISSTDKNENGDDEEIRINKRGLVYNMLCGLKDFENGNNQTFLAVVKKDDHVLSFSHEFYGSQPAENEKNSWIPVKDAIDEDCPHGGGGLQIIRESEMLLLFRFTKISFDEKLNEYVDKGQAVLVIGSKQKAEVRNFVNFINVEKIRLLLLIKEQVLEYLQKQFDNDAFIEVLEGREFRNYQTRLRHGLSDYLAAQNNYLENIVQGREIERSRLLFDIVYHAISGQLQAKKKDESPPKEERDIEEIKNVCKLLFDDRCLGGRKIDFSQIVFAEPPDKLIVKSYPAIFNVVLPELIINMKKNSPWVGEKDLFIGWENQVMIFRNKSRSPIDFSKINKNYGGLNMCNRILKDLGMNKLDCSEAAGDKFIIKLNLQSV